MLAPEGRWPGFMTAALPGDLEQKRAFSARERRPAPESPGMLRGPRGCCAARRLLPVPCLPRGRAPGAGGIAGIAVGGAGRDAVPC